MPRVANHGRAIAPTRSLPDLLAFPIHDLAQTNIVFTAAIVDMKAERTLTRRARAPVSVPYFHPLSIFQRARTLVGQTRVIFQVMVSITLYNFTGPPSARVPCSATEAIGDGAFFFIVDAGAAHGVRTGRTEWPSI